MSTWFRLENNVAVEPTDLDPAGRFHADLVWALGVADTQLGDVYNGSTWSRPAAMPPATAVPFQVSIMQGQLALLAVQSPKNSGKTLLDDVNAAVDASTDPRVKIAWSKATTLERQGLFVTQIAPGISGLDTSAALDALFIAADQISV